METMVDRLFSDLDNNAANLAKVEAGLAKSLKLLRPQELEEPEAYEVRAHVTPHVMPHVTPMWPQELEEPGADE
eukprot:613402-Prymnesium_polylepis.1